MKKIFIVMLAVFMAVTAVSCNKDKSGEMVQNFVNFKKAQKVLECVEEASFIDSCADVTTRAVNMTLSEIDSSTTYTGFLQEIIDALILEDEESCVSEVKESYITKKEGTITGKFDDDNDDINLTFTNVRIETKYDVEDDYLGYIKRQGETFELKISGTYKYSKSSDGTYTFTTDMEINGNDYNIEEVFTGDSSDRYYSSAKINGKSVSLKVLNAGLSGR